jgi:SEFIR domain
MFNQAFISYRRENDAHVERVRRFAEELRKQELVVAFDEFYQADHPGGPDEKWSRWCIDQAKESACVLIIGSPAWYVAFSSPQAAPPAAGLGAAAEANVIQEQLYQSKWIATRHRIVLLDDADAQGLPVEISGWRVFRPHSSTNDKTDLIRWAAELTRSKRLDTTSASWPETSPPLSWPMADHSAARKAFAALLTSKVQLRFLPICGLSETGKSHITRQMLGNVLAIPDIACGRFDFKGTTGMDNEVKAFVQQDLGVPEPAPNSRLQERLGEILTALKQRACPTLLIFDTYEMAGDAQDWVEKQLLPCLIRATWLRVVIAGQKVPDSIGAVWAAVAHPTVRLVTPEPADWFDYARQHRPDLTLSDVETACRLTRKSSVLDQLLGPAR